MSGPTGADADAVVIGGGVIGLAVAWRAAQRGLSVTLVDDGRPGQGSWAAAGMLAAVAELSYGEDDQLALSLRSAQLYPSFVAELEAATGIAVGYRPCGSILVAVDNDDHVQLADLCALHQRVGLGSHLIDRRGARELEPSLHPGIRSAMVIDSDHQIDNRRLLTALRAAAVGAGGRIEVGTASLDHDGTDTTVRVRRSSGWAGDDQEVRTGTVVVAAGCWSGSIDGLPVEARPPVRPVKGHILRLRCRPGQTLLDRTVRAFVHGAPLYLVPRLDGELVVGATMEDQGFDVTVTAGAVHDLLRDARDVVPDVAECELVECHAGLRAGSHDNAPVIGPSAVKGIIMATGHHRNGVLLAPVTADIVAGLLVGVEASR